MCETSDAQIEVETTIRQIYEGMVESSAPDVILDQPIAVDSHLKYMEHFLQNPLPPQFSALDVNHAWMVYWLVNAHVVLSGDKPSEELKQQVHEKIASLVLDNGYGGICGGPNGQIGHVASTYAAVLSLVLVKDFQLLAEIKKGLLLWFLTLKNSNGSFAMHSGGEHDTRSTYCVVVVTALLDISTPELTASTADWLLSCQTYEGGFAGVPHAEAHGGYTFCALGALFLLQGKEHKFNADAVVGWLLARQLHLEGGFSGRTNKLVDACYSFWVGASFVMVEVLTKSQLLFSRLSLATYIHNCCQNLDHGGLRDKPGKPVDFYHTNYTLCGLSMAEYTYTSESMTGFDLAAVEVTEGSASTVPVNPIFGLPLGYAEQCHAHFVE